MCHCFAFSASVCNNVYRLSPTVSACFPIFASQRLILSWDFPSDPLLVPCTWVAPFFSPVCIPACICLHFQWVYRARAPSQCVSNYMFLLEAPVSCVASPFVSVGQTGLRPASTEPSAGPAHRPGVSLPRKPQFMANHCRVRNGADTLVWPLCLAGVAQQQVTFHSTDQRNVERASPAQTAMLRNFNTTAQGVFGFFWFTLSAVMDNPLKLRLHGNSQRLLGTKKLGGRERWNALCNAKELELELPPWR